MNKNNTPLRLSIGAGLIFVTFLLFWPATNGNLFQRVSAAPAASPTPLAVPAVLTSKIDPAVLEAFEGHPTQKVSIIIYMTEKADLSEPNFAKASDSLQQIKAQRDEVYQVLTTTAQRSQAPLLNLLEGPSGGHSLSTTPVVSFWIFNGIAATLDYQTVMQVAARDDVKHIYLDEVIEIPPQEVAQDGVPNPLDANQNEWNITKIGVDRVWNEMKIDGSGVVVGIVDTGVYKDHPALKSKYRGNHTYQTYSFQDFVGGQPRPYDDNGHGTHVMGIILGDGGPGNRIGVAPGAEWIAAKAIDAYGSGMLRSLLRAMQWIQAPEGVASLAPDVVNSSWSSSCTSAYFYDVLVSMRSAGIVPIFSAGNSGPRPETIRQPACFPGAIAVGATDIEDKIAPWSSRGPAFGMTKPELVAPGVNIRSSVIGTVYESHSGTSMAAPVVTGVVALMLQANPSLALDQILTNLSNTTVDLGASGPDNDYGWGRIDAYRAVSGGEAPVGDVRLISPEGMISDKQPIYKWEAVANAQKYQLKVNDAAGNQIIAAWYQAQNVCDGSICSAQPSKTVEKGDFSWQIQVDAGAGNQPWSKPMSFTVSEGIPGKATLISPSGDIQDASPVYKWNAVDMAEKYQLKVEDTTGKEIFSAWYDVKDVCTNKPCQVKTTNSLQAGAYTWKVMASGTAGNGSWSDGMAFKVILPLPGEAVLISPKGLISETSPTYQWNTVTGAEKYQLSVKDQSGKEVISSWYQAANICNGDACQVKTTTNLSYGSYAWRIMASNAGGDSPWSQDLTFQVGEPAPSSPVLISPSGDTTSLPEFRWKDSGDAEEYKLRLQKASGESISAVWYPSKDICSNAECAVKSKTALDAGDYRWDVQANGDSGLSPWSAAMTFTVKDSAAIPAVPISPSGETKEAMPLFTWKASENAQKYEIKVALTSGETAFSATYLAGDVCKGSTCSAKIDSALPEGEYQWQIMTTYADGKTVWSEAMRFKESQPAPPAAELIAPRGEVGESQPEFRWKPALGASEYRLKISGASGDILRTWYKAEDICSDAVCAVKPAVTLDGGDYTWQVQTTSPTCGGPWSETVGFKVKESAPGVAILLVPVGNVSETQPTFRWNEVRKAREYELRINNAEGKTVYDKWFRAVDFCANGTCTGKISTVLSSGPYTWQVLASNQVSDGAWSSPVQFTVLKLPPAGPSMRKPSGNITEKQPIFEWLAAQAANEYQLNVIKASGESVLSGWFKAVDICTNEVCTVRSTSEFNLGTYTWRVRAGNSAGIGTWSTGGSFIVSAAPLGAASPISPNGAVDNAQPSFQWYFLQGATQYQLKVVGPAGGAQNVLQKKMAAEDVCSGATCSVTLPNHFSDGQYVWQVLSFDEAGMGAWSKTMNFSVSEKTSSILPLATQSPTLPATPVAPKEEAYLVKEGDALITLAAQWGIPLQELAALNQIVYPYVIRAGQELKRPPQPVASNLLPKDVAVATQTPLPTPVPTQNVSPSPVMDAAVSSLSGGEYTVQTGDYLMKLAREWGVVWKDVVDTNHLKYPYILSPGQTLKIP